MAGENRRNVRRRKIIDAYPLFPIQYFETILIFFVTATCNGTFKSTLRATYLPEYKSASHPVSHLSEFIYHGGLVMISRYWIVFTAVAFQSYAVDAEPMKYQPDIVVEANNQFACSVEASEPVPQAVSASETNAGDAIPEGLAPEPLMQAAVPLVLEAGTILKLKMTDLITSRSKECGAGEKVRLEVAEAVTVDNFTAVPVGTPAFGKITYVEHKGGDGRRGTITGQLVSLQLGDRSIPISGNFQSRGKSGKLAGFAASAFVPLANFFITGTSAKIPPGTIVEGELLVTVELSGTQTNIVPARVPLAVASGQKLTQ